MAETVTPAENHARMLRGELYHAFTPELMAARRRAADACERYNTAEGPTRRQQVEMIRCILGDDTPLPAALSDADVDAHQLMDEPWIDRPIRMDYGTNVELGRNVYINFNCVILDTCRVRIGARTLVGPNVSFFAGTHPLDPALRNGTRGPELGRPIDVGEDCWFGGNVVVLPGVCIGRGCTIGAGSVVTKNVPDFHVVAGNPARIIRKVKTSMDQANSNNSVENRPA